MQAIDDLKVFIQREGDGLVTDSRAVAIAFGRRHADVLKTIARMLESGHPEIREHGERNFSLTSYTDSQGREKPMYRTTAKGLSELAMGFTGDQSRVIRIRFLNAFEEVADRLASAERSILERLHAHERRDGQSKAKAAIGSQLMHQRRREKPELDAECAALMELAQPRLMLVG